MNTLELFIVLSCFFQSDFAQGLHRIFPEIEVTGELENRSDENDGDNLYRPARDDRLSILSSSLSTVGKLLEDGSTGNALNSYHPESTRTSQRFGPLKNVIVPSLKRKIYKTNGHGALVSSGFFSFIDYPSNSEANIAYEQPQVYDFEQKMPFLIGKRNSAITPPSRDWCRLIGYRVCPRALLART